MPSHSRIIYIDGSAVGIACSRGPKATQHCSCEGGCGAAATKQCDYPLRFGTKVKGTCSRYICEAHATKIDGDRDYCPAHARKAARDAEGR
jgi:hypothetical protein